MFTIKKWFCGIGFLILLFGASSVYAQIPLPSAIGGSVSVNGVLLTQAAAATYTFVVTKPDGTAFDPAAETVGLNADNKYLIKIPAFNANTQPGGARSGSTAVIHVYRDGVELTVTTPPDGRFTVGAEGSVTEMNIEVAAPRRMTGQPGVLLLLLEN